MPSKTSRQGPSVQGQRDLLVLLIAALLVFFFSAEVDLFEKVHLIADRHEGLEIDELFITAGFLLVGLAWYSLRRRREAVTLSLQLARRTEELEKALAEIRVLKGILPICSSCKKIRDEQGVWRQLESYISQHSNAEFSHGLCPDCIRKLYPDIDLSSEP